MAKPKFTFPQMEGIYEAIPEEYKEVFEWMYETTKVEQFATVILGSMTACAVANPNITFWEAMAEAKDHFEKSLQVFLVSSKLSS
jgi:murein L,D-transpeptidase YafK